VIPLEANLTPRASEARGEHL